MSVTVVVDQNGVVLHDCTQMWCAVSWDGYDIKTGAPVNGRTNPNPKDWKINGNTAKYMGKEKSS